MSTAVARWVRALERDWNPADHPRAPGSAPGGIGGQFISGLIHGLVGHGGRSEQGSAVGRFTSRGGSVASIALHPRRPRIDDRVRDPRTGKLGRVQTMHADGTGRVAWDDGQVESRHLGELEDPYAQRQLPDPERTFHAEQGPRPTQVDTALSPAPPGKIATQWGMATEGPLAPSQRGYLHKFKEAAPRSAAIYDSDRADTEELRARGLITVNARNGMAKITNRGQRELSTPGSSDPGPHRRTAAERMRDGIAAGKAIGRDRQRALDIAAGRKPRPTSAEIDDRIADAAGAPGAPDLAPVPSKARRRPQAAFDPLSVYVDGGEASLRERLATLDAEQLGDIVAYHGMDPARVTRRWTDRDRLTGWIVARSHDRATKGNAFRPPRVPEFRDHPSAEPLTAPAKKATAAQRMSQAKPKRPSVDIAAALRSATTRDEADAHLQDLTIGDLGAVADELGIPRSALRGKGSRKEDIRSALVDIEVGGRAQFAAMFASQSGDDYRPPRLPGGPSLAVAKMARGKAPSGPRPSGLPTDRKATATDFEDLAVRVSKLRTAEQRQAVLADLNATELNTLARQFPGDPVRTVSGTTSDRRTVLKIPAGLSIEERRRWLAGRLSGVREGDLPKAEGAVAKMARVKAPPMAAGSKPDGPEVRTAWTFDMGPGVAQQYGRTGGDEPLYLPNRGADQGLVHLDSQLGQLWTALTADNREPNSFVNAAAHIGEDVGTGKISLDEAADRLRQLSARATDQAVARRIDATIRGITESSPPPRIDVPDNVPPSVRRWLDDLARIPTMRKTDLPRNRREQSALDEALALVREISQQGLTGQRTMSAGDAEMRLLGITQNVHESIDGVYHARRLTGRTFNTENPDWPAIRDWLRGRR